MSHFKFLPICILLISLMPLNYAHAQASLIAENTITGVAVEVKRPDGSDETQTFTLVRDVRKAEQWYYFPNQPRLTENVIAGARVPEFSLIRFTVPRADGQLGSGAIMTFAVSLGASAEALEKLKARLKAEVKELSGTSSNSLRLSPVPINSATAAVYSPETGDLLANVDSNSVTVPTDGAGKIVFAVKMNDIGADVFKAMADGTGGIPVWIKYNFNGITPPAGFKITANWDQAYSFYSSDERFRARASYYGWFSASAAADRTYIRDSLLQNGAIKVESITGGNFTAETLDSYLQPIVKRLNDQLLQQLRPPPKINPATAASPSASGVFGGAGYSVATKDVSLVKKGSEVWDFSFSSIIERAGAANGLISVRGYAPEIRRAVVVNVDGGDWSRVYYSMPRVPPSLDAAALKARLRSGQQTIAERQFIYKPSSGWINASGNQPVNGVWISLLAHADKDRKTFVWENSYSFSLDKYEVRATTTVPLDGEGPIIAPVDLMRVVRVSGDGLPLDGPEAKMVSVDVHLKDGVRSGKKSFRVETISGTKRVTPDLLWPVSIMGAGAATRIEAEIVFNYTDRSPCRVTVSKEQFPRLFVSDEIILRLLTRECPS